jgi:hypothetical protein
VQSAFPMCHGGAAEIAPCSPLLRGGLKSSWRLLTIPQVTLLGLICFVLYSYFFNSLLPQSQVHPLSIKSCTLCPCTDHCGPRCWACRPLRSYHRLCRHRRQRRWKMWAAKRHGLLINLHQRPRVVRPTV